MAKPKREDLDMIIRMAKYMLNPDFNGTLQLSRYVALPVVGARLRLRGQDGSRLSGFVATEGGPGTEEFTDYGTLPDWQALVVVDDFVSVQHDVLAKTGRPQIPEIIVDRCRRSRGAANFCARECGEAITRVSRRDQVCNGERGHDGQPR